MIASGGNDNNLILWDIRNYEKYLKKIKKHTAAVTN